VVPKLLLRDPTNRARSILRTSSDLNPRSIHVEGIDLNHHSGCPSLRVHLQCVRLFARRTACADSSRALRPGATILRCQLLHQGFERLDFAEEVRLVVRHGVSKLVELVPRLTLQQHVVVDKALQTERVQTRVQARLE